MAWAYGTRHDGTATRSTIPIHNRKIHSLIDEAHPHGIACSLLDYSEFFAEAEVVRLRDLHPLDHLSRGKTARQPVLVELLHGLRNSIQPHLRFLELLQSPSRGKWEHRERHSIVGE